MKVIQKSDTHTCFRLENETGSGEMELFQVFEGIYLAYNDFRLQTCESDVTTNKTRFGVEHCREGKIEWQLENGDFAYLGAGCLMPCDYDQNGQGHFEFPSRVYQGVTLYIELPMAQQGLPAAFDIDLSALHAHIQTAGTLDLTGDSRATFVLGMVYEAQHQSMLHKKMACLELLLFLSELKWTDNAAQPLYFPAAQVMKVKEIEQFLNAHLEVRYTLQELSERFGLSVSTIRRCFSGVFGYSVAEYMKKRRIDEAVQLLSQTELPIADISTNLGYENPSKFAAVFRSYMQISPQMYRRQFKTK